MIAVVGSVEELGVSEETRALMRDQLETNCFGPINLIKAALPGMRMKRSGHIVVSTSISMGEISWRSGQH